jgi:alpha-tubulin suppressor-like RCC1 family protein
VRVVAVITTIAVAACGARTGLGVSTTGGGGATEADAGDGGVAPRRRTLSVSWDTACAIVSGDRVACWGDNSGGLVGDVSALYPTPTIVAGLADVVEIAVGQLVSCALARDGGVWCWGDSIGSRAPVRVSALPRAERLFAGSGTVCAITTDARVACAGDAFLDGDACATQTGHPPLDTLVVPSIDHVVDLALGQQHACAVRADASVWCWGCGDSGVLGTVGAGNHADPIPVSGLSATRVAAETSASCALTTSGGATCWGDSSQFGFSLTIAPGPPRDVPFFAGALDIDVGVVFSCAAMRDAVACDGALYDFATCADHRVDRRTFGIPGVREISVGYEDVCARDATGSVWCWGCNLTGIAGDIALKGQANPVRVAL